MICASSSGEGLDMSKEGERKKKGGGFDAGGFEGRTEIE